MKYKTPQTDSKTVSRVLRQLRSLRHVDLNSWRLRVEAIVQRYAKTGDRRDLFEADRLLTNIRRRIATL